MKKLAIFVAVLFCAGCGQGVERAPGVVSDVGGNAVALKRLAPGAVTMEGGLDAWKALGVEPLSGLTWKGSFEKPAREEQRRIKQVRLAFDATDLYLVLELIPGIKEHFEAEGTSGSVLYLYVDADAASSTGHSRNTSDSTGGWERRVYIAEGFSVSLSDKPSVPLVDYTVERIERGVVVQSGPGFKYEADYEAIPGGEKSSLSDPSSIVFKSDILTLRIPLATLGIRLPATVRFCFEDLGAFPNAETTITVRIE